MIPTPSEEHSHLEPAPVPEIPKPLSPQEAAERLQQWAQTLQKKPAPVVELSEILEPLTQLEDFHPAKPSLEWLAQPGTLEVLEKMDEQYGHDQVVEALEDWARQIIELKYSSLLKSLPVPPPAERQETLEEPAPENA